MKRKFFFALGMISLMSSHAFGLDIVNGKLISHEEHTIGNGKFSFQDSKMKSNFKPNFKNHFMNQSGYENFIGTSVNANPVFPVIPGSQAYLSGKHKLTISNYSTSPNTYSIWTIICANLIKDNGSMQYDTCAYTIEKITLEPGGFAFEDRESSLNAILDSNKNYFSYVSTQVLRNLGDTVYLSEDTQPISFIDSKKHS